MKNKPLSLLVSVLMAVGLWLYVITTVSPGSEAPYYNIPVVFEGESVLTERGLMITSGTETMVNLRLSGNRSDLNKIRSSDITLKADLSKIYDPGVTELDYAIVYPGNFAQNAFTTQSKHPESIKLTVERRINKQVPVVISYQGKVPEGFMTDKDNVALDYMEIPIVGPQSVVDKIAQARIEVDLKDQSNTISQNYAYTLCDKDGNPVDVELVTTEVAEVHMDLKIHRFKEVPLKVNVTYGGGASEKNTTVTVEPGTIKVSGNDTMMEQLNEVILGSINLRDITEDTVATYPIVLPEGVTNLSGVSEATASISFRDLAMRDFAVRNIEAVNVPQGMEYDILNEVLKVTIRGPRALIEKLTEEQIVLKVDLTDMEVGTTTVKPTVSFTTDDFEGCGAIGTYSVSVTLQEKVEKP